MNLDLSGTALDVAPRLLGGVLISRVGGLSVRVRIVEVEAYLGAHDPGSHAYRGRTARNAVMFGPAGHLYVYRHLGLHHCINVVCGQPGTATAVLLRAAEVIDGEKVAWQRRQAAGVCRTPRDLARGPGRLAVALGLTGEHDGVAIGFEVDGPELVALRSGGGAVPVVRGGRVGVNGPGGDSQRYPWRYHLAGDPHVSAFRAGKV